MVSRKTKNGSIVLFFILCSLVSLALLLWRCKYGFAYEDESFYLTIPYRLCRGDQLLIHEWHGTQLSGLLLLPLVKAYLGLFNSTEGILLSFRIIFSVVWWGAGLFLFFRLSRLTFSGSILAFFVFVFYVPYGIMALSYNSLGILLFLAFCTIVVSVESYRTIQLVFAGVLFAGAVLCCPYLIAFWFAVLLFSLVCSIFRIKPAISYKTWSYFRYITYGAGLVFTFFCFLLFRGAPLSDYIKVLPMILSDPEHPSGAWIEKLKMVIYYGRELNELWFPGTICALLVTLISKVTKRVKLGFIIICVIVAALLISYSFGFHIINFYMFPICFLGLYCGICSDNKCIKRCFCYMWIPGFGFAVCNSLSSNQAYFAFSSASTVMAVASVVMGALFCKDIQKEDQHDQTFSWTSIFVVTAFLLITGLQSFLLADERIRVVYGDRSGGLVSRQTVEIEQGPHKGLMVTEDDSEYYETMMEDLQSLRFDKNCQNVLFLSIHTWLYLCAEKDIASYSAWLSGVNDETFHRLERYYQLFPEKIPDIIVVDRDFRDSVHVFIDKEYELASNTTSQYTCVLTRRCG